MTLTTVKTQRTSMTISNKDANDNSNGENDDDNGENGDDHD